MGVVDGFLLSTAFGVMVDEVLATALADEFSVGVCAETLIAAAVVRMKTTLRAVRSFELSDISLCLSFQF
jgi:hypothetical protein